MKISALDCLREAASALLVPYGAHRVWLLGDMNPGVPLSDSHLLVEFTQSPRPLTLSSWLQLQRALGERCGLRVELVAVSGLEQRVDTESISRKLLLDVGGQHG
jgi:predicted nucleotidyltransferase